MNHRHVPFLALVVVLTCPAVSRAATRVPLTVSENQGVRRVREPVTFGVPIPKGELADEQHARLLLDGREVPVQCRATGLWRPGRSVRWLLVDCRVDLPPRTTKTYTLEYGPDVSARAKPAWGPTVREDKDAVFVDTHAAQFQISKRRFTLFDKVTARGQTVIAPAGQAADRGAVLAGLRAMVTRVIPAPTNKGRGYLVYVQCAPNVKQEDYTLRFVADREYEITGAASGPAGRGTFRKDFAATTGAIGIPGDAWLNYHMPRKGDTFTFRTVPAGSAFPAESVTDVCILERGPLRSVIRLKGTFGPASAAVMEYTAWYHFYAGSARVKVAFTLENNDHGGRTDTGNARNANIGGVNCVFFDGMSLRLPVGQATGHKAAGVAWSGMDKDPRRPTCIYQDSAGGPNWNRYAQARYHPRPTSYVRFRKARVGYDGKAPDADSVERPQPWLYTGGERGVCVAVRNFWQNAPKLLALTPAGGVRIALFPREYAGEYAFRSGEHKTHEVLFDFDVSGASGAENAVQVFQHPLRLEASSPWYARTKALGELHSFDPDHYKAYEVRNLSTIGRKLDGSTHTPSLLSRIEEHNILGWMDYGDMPIDFESPSGQWGMKYDMDYHMAQQWARTGRQAWWRLFVAADRHTADIDIHHQPHYPGLHFVKGGVWAHSTHDEPGHKNPHRNYNHFTKDLCFGARGTAALYYLTGYWKAHDACLEIAENALAQYMSPQRDPGPASKNNRMGWRGDACTLNRLLEGYLLSGEARYLQHARWQVASCAFDGKPAKHRPISLWSSVFYMMALARYVELFPDDTRARNYLLAHVETLRKSFRPGQGVYYTITPKPDGSVVGKGTVSHYNIMAADALAIAYRLTGKGEYLDTARQCFAYGVKNATWTPTYQQVHSANGALHGNVFMVVDTQARGAGK